MEDFSGGQFVFLCLVLVWLVIVLAGMMTSMRRREQAHRERLAMIEKGLLPPDLYPDGPPPPPGAYGAPRYRDRPARQFARKLGVLIVFGAAGVGWLLYVLGERQVALGITGLLGLIGLGFIAISFNLTGGDRYYGPPPSWPQGPQGPPHA